MTLVADDTELFYIDGSSHTTSTTYTIDVGIMLYNGFIYCTDVLHNTNTWITILINNTTKCPVYYNNPGNDSRMRTTVTIYANKGDKITVEFGNGTMYDLVVWTQRIYIK